MYERANTDEADDLAQLASAPPAANRTLANQNEPNEQLDASQGAQLDLERREEIDSARNRLSGLVTWFFLRVVPGHWRRYERFRAAAALGRIEPLAPAQITVAAVPVGLGKSTTAGVAIGELLNQDAEGDRAIVYFVPRHALADELAKKFTEVSGLPAAIWRGTNADDPREPGKAMCVEPELSSAAHRAHVTLETVCKVCPSLGVCGYRRQHTQNARLWFLPHQSLFSGRPAPVSDPIAIVIDESFWQAGLVGGDRPIQLAVSTLDARSSNLPVEEIERLVELRERLKHALSMVGDDGRLTRRMLETADLFAEDVTEAYRIEWLAKPSFRPMGNVGEIIDALELHSKLFDYRLPRLWTMVKNCLQNQTDFVTGLRVERNARLRGGEGQGDVLLMQWRREISEI